MPPQEANPPVDPCFDDVPIFKTFFHEPENFERIHVSVIGVNTHNKDGSKAQGIRDSGGLFQYRSGKPDVYVEVKTEGTDTGNCDHFKINEHTFSTKAASRFPVWHERVVLTTLKKGTERVVFTFKDGNNSDEVIGTHEVQRSSITTGYGGDWEDFNEVISEEGRMKGVMFSFRLRVTDGSEKYVSKGLLDSYFQDTETHTYTEEVIPDETTNNDEDNALLQCWRKKGEPNKKAVIWILGRNDCFMHPHAAQPLFFDQGFDLYVLNYRMNGACRKMGWYSNPSWNSHNKVADFDVYIQEIGKAMKIIADNKYSTTLGYAHSTGGPILFDYLLEKGDNEFDGFILNSPFMDIPTGEGVVGAVGDLLVNSFPFLKCIGFRNNEDWFMSSYAADFPKSIGPMTYMDMPVVIDNAYMRNYSLYYFPFHSRPIYSVPMTIGYVDGVNKIHAKIGEVKDMKRVVTTKPFLCISSRADDVLEVADTMSQVDWIGPGRCEVELKNNSHDVFLSNEVEDNTLAIDSVKAWMKAQKFDI